MTVCIAAIADKGSSLVLATDKMLTSVNSSVPYQYEQEDVNKIYHLTDNKIVLLAGTIQHAFAILENTKKKVGANTTKKLNEVVVELKKQYDEYRNCWLEEGILKPRGLTLQEYYQNHAKYQPTFTQGIDQQIATSKFDVEFIVVGYEDNNWHVFLLQSNLHPQLKTTEGYTTIGTGGPHATYSMLDLEYSKSKSLSDVRAIVERAKNKAEKSPGVGKGLNLESYNKETKA